MGNGETVERRERTAGRKGAEGDGSTAAPAKGIPLLGPVPKCPYLAGRPPCGTHHLFPSSANVCWARPGEQKPYQVISAEIQDSHCFGGPDGVSRCAQYQQAVTVALAPPQFERPRPGVPSGPEWALPPHAQTQRRAQHGKARLRRSLLWLAPCLLVIALIALLLR